MIPVALDRKGGAVIPSCSRDEGPFTCMGCSKSLVLKQGDKKVFHFAHKAFSSTCSGGGESAVHKAAKLILATYSARFTFSGGCKKGHRVEKRYDRSTGVNEYRYDNLHSADVALFEEGVIRSIVEVRVTHATTDEALWSRNECVGVTNVWEVRADDVLKAQDTLYVTKDCVSIGSLLTYPTPLCDNMCHVYIECLECGKLGHRTCGLDLCRLCIHPCVRCERPTRKGDDLCLCCKYKDKASIKTGTLPKKRGDLTSYFTLVRVPNKKARREKHIQQFRDNGS